VSDLLARVAVKSDQTNAPLGAIPAKGVRKPRPGEVVAARVAARRPDAPAAVEGVTLLNPGFFALERMRAANASKARWKPRGKVRG
jgi:hypothetical protein